MSDAADITDQVYKDAIDDATKDIRERLDSLTMFLADCRVRIISNYNGQPFGTSKPPLTGKEFEIESISIGSWQKASIYLHLKGQRCSVFPNEVEFI